MTINRRSIFKMLWPIVLELLLGTAAMIISTALATGISLEATAAVGFVNPVNFLLIGVLGAFSAGITVVVAQAIGRGDVRDAGNTTSQATVALTLITTMLSILLIILGPLLVRTLFVTDNTEVQQLTNIYLRYVSVSLPFMAVFACLGGLMRATGNNLGPLFASMLGNVALIVVVYATRAMGLEIDALGLGMLANRVFGAGLLIYLQMRGIGTIVINRIKLKIQKAVIAPVLKISIPAMLDSFFFSGTKLIVVVFMVDMGEAVVIANMIGQNVASILLIPGVAVATVVPTIIGQLFGRGDIPLVRKQMVKLMGLSSLLQLGMTLLSLPLMNALINMNIRTSMEDATRIASLSYDVLLLYTLLLPVFWAPAFVIPNALRGVSDVKYTVWASLFTLIVVRLFGAWLLGRHFGMGLMGIWIAMMADWVARSAFFLPRIWSKKWVPEIACSDGINTVT